MQHRGAITERMDSMAKNATFSSSKNYLIQRENGCMPSASHNLGHFWGNQGSTYMTKSILHKIHPYDCIYLPHLGSPSLQKSHKAMDTFYL